MTDTPESPVETLRRAAEAAPKVLPSAIAEVIEDYLIDCAAAIEAGSTPQGLAEGAEVLALAEQQQTRPVARQDALDKMSEADQQPGQSRFYRYDRMLTALETAGWGPCKTVSEPSGDVVETVANALAEVRLQIGPNTRSLIADGHWKQMPLSVGERHTIAETAVAAMPQQGVTPEQLELLREIAARLTSHGDSIANLYTAVDARPIWEAARDIETLTAELGAQEGEQ